MSVASPKQLIANWREHANELSGSALTSEGSRAARKTLLAMADDLETVLRQEQAGVSADQMREQFEAWWLARHPNSQFNDLKRTGKSGAYDKEWLNDCWLAWKAAIATAPPEQARCPDCDEAAKHAYSDATTPGFFYSKCERHREQPQAASDGALSAEQLAEAMKDYDCGFVTRTTVLARLNAMLASHDQKVRAEVRGEMHESYEPMKEALIQFMKATLRIANDAAEIVTLRLPCHCDAQDGTPCTRCNVIREIRALAAPAASKPEAAHE